MAVMMNIPMPTALSAGLLPLAALFVHFVAIMPVLVQGQTASSHMRLSDTRQERDLIADVVEPEHEFDLEENHSKLLRTRVPVARTSIIDSEIVEVTQFGPNELEIIGLKAGSTDLTLWFGDANAPPREQTILRYRVRVKKSSDPERIRENEFEELETKLNEFFPNSSVEIVLVNNTIVVRGQARDAEDAANILSMVRRQIGATGYNSNNSFVGDATNRTGRGGFGNVVNMLKIPGEQQVMLKVRVAELTRSALRELGLDFNINNNSFALSNNFGNAGNLVSILNNNEVTLLMRAVSTNGYSKVLAEPNLVTLSGKTASFIAGGQFAVPTAVGIGGVQAATTSFQGFGTQLQFTPTVLDKDRIRLRVAPTFSSLNNGNTVNGIPGLNTRSVYTTVDMREGQWLAIAGLIQDQQEGSKARLPWIGDVPLGGALFGSNRIKRDETELLILVSPQLIHPLDESIAPTLLPGMEVKEPNNAEFFLGNRVEGNPSNDFRSTVWPNEIADVQRAPAQSSRQSKSQPRYQQAQGFYLQSQHGFVDER